MNRYLLAICIILILVYLLGNWSAYALCYSDHRARGYAMFTSREAIANECRYHLLWPFGY